MFNSRHPIPEITYHDGIHSAYATITALYGKDLPPHLKRDMGIVQVDIYKQPNKDKPYITFTPESTIRTIRAKAVRKSNYNKNKEFRQLWGNISGMR
jgi:hypothetical protein